jgi:hypothetical protein
MVRSRADSRCIGGSETECGGTALIGLLDMLALIAGVTQRSFVCWGAWQDTYHAGGGSSVLNSNVGRAVYEIWVLCFVLLQLSTNAEILRPPTAA